MRLLLFLLPLTSAYNFLIYNPLFGHSHTNFLGRIADVLTDAGHNVTVLMPVADRRLENKTGVRTTTDIIKVQLSNELSEDLLAMWEENSDRIWAESMDPVVMYRMSQRVSKTFSMMCRDMMAKDDVISHLKERHFDVGIAEPMLACGLGLFDVIGLPSTVSALSTPPLDIISEMIGQPTAPSYVPGAMSLTSGGPMSIWERFLNLLHSKLTMKFFKSVFGEEQLLLKGKYGEGVRDIEELMAGVSFQLINTNPLLDFPFPTIQKNVAIGGIQVNIENKEQVDEKWDAILNERPRNVLVSFGSMARSESMSDSYKSSLLSAFESMPDTTFIWKYEEEGATLADHLPNVHLSTWVPQNALLGDSRLTMMITHGGLGSTTELAHFGKPSIMIPLFGDQSRNAAMLSRHGGAEVLEKFDLADTAKIRNTIQKVLNESSYASNALRLSQMLRDQPFSAQQLVLRHCEFAAKFGPLPQLDPYGRHLSFIQYFLLDIAAIIITSLILTMFIVKKIISYCCCRASKPKTD